MDWLSFSFAMAPMKNQHNSVHNFAPSQKWKWNGSASIMMFRWHLLAFNNIQTFAFKTSQTLLTILICCDALLFFLWRCCCFLSLEICVSLFFSLRFDDFVLHEIFKVPLFWFSFNVFMVVTSNQVTSDLKSINVHT